MSSLQHSHSPIGSHSVLIPQFHVRIPERPTEFITVHDSHDKTRSRKFHSKTILSSYGAEPLRGRGTRVFEAFELDERGAKKGSAVVLMDIWIDNDRMREGAIHAQLYDEVDAADKKLLKKYFLTTVCHGDVCIGPNVDGTDCSLFQLQKESVPQIHREGEVSTTSIGVLFAIGHRYYSLSCTLK